MANKTENLVKVVNSNEKTTLYFRTLDSDVHTVKLNKKVIAQVSKRLNDLLPHATFGHSEEKEQWYRANPAMLIAENYKEREDE